MDRLLYLNDVYLGVGETLLLLDNENLYQQIEGIRYKRTNFFIVLVMYYGNIKICYVIYTVF